MWTLKYSKWWATEMKDKGDEEVKDKKTKDDGLDADDEQRYSLNNVIWN